MAHFHIDWGDGTETEVPRRHDGDGQAMPDVAHAYKQPGVYTITVQAVQPDYSSVVVSSTLTVTVDAKPAVLAYGGYTSNYHF